MTALVDRNGNVSGRYDYDAFGNLTEEVDGVGNPYKYAGEEHDSETGLYNLKARYYSPKTARFVSEDSYRGRYADPLSLNLYTYCHNEPMMYVDPSGHSPTFVPYEDNGDGFNHEGLRWLKEAYKNAETDEEKLKRARQIDYYEGAQRLGRDILYDDEARNDIRWLEAKAYDKPVPKGVKEPKETNKLKGEVLAKEIEEKKKNQTLDAIQTALDVAGYAPGIGSIADVINGMIYFARGKTAEGVASMISIVPVLGDLAGGAMKTFIKLGGASIAAANTPGKVTSLFKVIAEKIKGQLQKFTELVLKVKKGEKETKTLYHYTNEKGMNGIVDSKLLNPSLKANNPKDARYGNGQYLSDIKPGSKTPAQLAKEFINVPNKHKYTNYVEINIKGLNVVKGRDGVFVIPNEGPLDIKKRILNWGSVK